MWSSQNVQLPPENHTYIFTTATAPAKTATETPRAAPDIRNAKTAVSAAAAAAPAAVKPTTKPVAAVILPEDISTLNITRQPTIRAVCPPVGLPSSKNVLSPAERLYTIIRNAMQIKAWPPAGEKSPNPNAVPDKRWVALFAAAAVPSSETTVFRNAHTRTPPKPVLRKARNSSPNAMVTVPTKANGYGTVSVNNRRF